MPLRRSEDPLELMRMRPLMDTTEGRQDIKIGVIDGPVDFSHPALRYSNIKRISDSHSNICKNAGSLACKHGTFICGILCADRKSQAPAICPGCQILLRPIFNENIQGPDLRGAALPRSSPDELADALVEMVEAGAEIINLSVGISTSSILARTKLQDAYDYAFKNDVLIVSATGNNGTIGYSAPLYHPWVIPVAACDERGEISPLSNFGPSVSRMGLLAPGTHIQSALPGGGYARMSGTSFAAPFVTGMLALLESVHSNVTHIEIMNSVLSLHRLKRAIFPRLANAEQSLKNLSFNIQNR